MSNEREDGKEKYFLDLKENTSLLASLGGAFVGLLVFHYSIFKIREAEFFKVDTDMTNQSIVIEGIGKFVSVIIFLTMLVSLYHFSTYVPRKKLSGKIVQVKDGLIRFELLIAILSIVALIILLICAYFIGGYKGDIPETKYAFSLLCMFIILHMTVALINFGLTKIDFKNTTIVDVPVLMQLLYVGVLFFFLLAPFIYIDLEITGTESIVVTKDNHYMLVEKNQGEVLLREMKPKGDPSENEFYLTDKYIPMDAKKIVFKEQPIMESVNFEKEGFLKFEVEGKN